MHQSGIRDAGWRPYSACSSQSSATRTPSGPFQRSSSDSTTGATSRVELSRRSTRSRRWLNVVPRRCCPTHYDYVAEAVLSCLEGWDLAMREKAFTAELRRSERYINSEISASVLFGSVQTLRRRGFISDEPQRWTRTRTRTISLLTPVCKFLAKVSTSAQEMAKQRTCHRSRSTIPIWPQTRLQRRKSNTTSDSRRSPGRTTH